jgi:hypothetical protein
MSVNLYLSLRVSGYDPSRVNAIKEAIQAVLVREEIDDDMSPIAESGEGVSRTLESRSNPEMPVIISGAYIWLPEVQEQMSKAVEEANGSPCNVEFEGEYDDLDEDNE